MHQLSNGTQSESSFAGIRDELDSVLAMLGFIAEQPTNERRDVRS
jgi:hypothetical protein